MGWPSARTTQPGPSDIAHMTAELSRLRAENAELREALETLTGVIGLTPLPYNKEAVQEAFDAARASLAKRGEGA